MPAWTAEQYFEWREGRFATRFSSRFRSSIAGQTRRTCPGLVSEIGSHLFPIFSGLSDEGVRKGNPRPVPEV